MKEYVLALRTYNYYRTTQIIHFIRVADLQSKGIEGGNMTDGEIMRELIFKILHPVAEKVFTF